MSDLISREDALALRDNLADIIGALPMSSIHSALSEYRNAIRALPAVQPAPRRATGPIDPEAGFATTGAEARWIADVDAGVYDAQPDAREAALREAALMVYDEEDESHPRPWENWGEHKNMLTAQTVAIEIRAAILAMIDNPGKEVMPVVPPPTNQTDTAPAGLSAGGGAEPATEGGA